MAVFDMGPQVTGSYKEFVMRPALWSIPVVCASILLGQHGFANSLIYGVILGIMDTVIYVTGVRRAMPYSHDPNKGLRIMGRYKWYRLFAIGSIVVLMLKRGFDVMGTCFGLLLIHIFLIINLTIIAYRINNQATRRKE